MTMDTGVESKTGYELIQQIVEGTGDAGTLHQDRIAANAEILRRTESYHPGADPQSEEFAIYRLRGALFCYDLDTCSNLELRVVVRWAVNRFKLSFQLWWEDEEYHPGYVEGGEG